MADMRDAYAIARAIDGRLAHADAALAAEALDAYRDALYDYRGDGDLDAFLARCDALLASLPTGVAEAAPTEGACHRALDSVFSSG